MINKFCTDLNDENDGGWSKFIVLNNAAIKNVEFIG
jgi:hypothetical protein